MAYAGHRGFVLVAAMIAGLALAQPGCGPGVFACAGDEDCSAAGGAGTCEATGYCSFPDQGCASGSRYGDHAGDSLAGDCVPTDGDTSGSASTTDTGITAATTAMTLDATGSPDVTGGPEATGDPSGDPSTDTTPSDTSGGPMTVCGNGAVEPGESCDDENRIDGDGCNANCVLSGEVLWQIVEDGPAGLADGAASIDIDDSDGLYVGAWFSHDDGPRLAARKLALDGGIAWTTVIDTPIAWGSVYAWGIAVDDAGNAYLAGDGQAGDSPYWIATQLDGMGGAGWLVVEGGQAFGVALDTNVWVAGLSAGDEPRIVGYSTGGEQLFELVGNPSQPTDGIPWDIAAVDGELFVVGEVALGDSFAYGVNLTAEGGIIAAFELEGEWTQALALARGPEEWWVVGRSNTHDGGWLARGSLDLEAIAGPDIMTPAGVSASLHGVAFGPAGEAVAVGWQDTGGDFDALVQSYAPDGALMWTRTYDGGAGINDYARDVVIASNGTIVVAGHVGPLTDTGDFWVFALDK